MSIDATRWAWGVQIQASRKIVLLSMADRASEHHECWPSITRLVGDTCLDRKTIMDAISDLEKSGHITVKRVMGKGNCYQLSGVSSRETSPKNGTGTSPKNGTGTSPKNGTGTENGTGINLRTSTENGTAQYQKRDGYQSQKRDTEPTIESINNQPTPQTPKTSAGKPADVVPSGFAQFWAAWPANDRKQAKGKCLDVWKKAHAERDAALVLSHVAHLAASPSWTKDAGQFIPAPLTYLNKRAWEGFEPETVADSATSAMFAGAL